MLTLKPLRPALVRQALREHDPDEALSKPRWLNFSTLVPRFLVYVIGPRVASKWAYSDQFLVSTYGQLLGQ